MAASPQTHPLVAGVVLTVNFDADFDRVELTCLVAGAVAYFRLDGVDPVGAAAGVHALPSVVGATVERSVPSGGLTQVRLISTGTPTVHIRAFN